MNSELNTELGVDSQWRHRYETCAGEEVIRAKFLCQSLFSVVNNC